MSDRKRRRERGRAPAIAVVVVAAALLAGCGERSEDTTGTETHAFDLALDFYVNPDHAGIYTALEEGYFEEAGLDVAVHVPSDPAAPIKQVAAGRVDLAVSYEPEVLLARDQGLPVVAVGALVDQPLTSLIWTRDSGLKKVADLKGKTVVTAGIPYQRDYLEAILDDEGLALDDVRVTDVGLGLLPAVLSKRADAMLGGFSNIEGVDLELRGKDPTVLPVDELGIPAYDELVLVANEDGLDDDEDPVRLFLGALERGTQAAADDPREATRTILSAGEGLDPKFTRAEIDATLPLLIPRDDDSWGFMDPREWERFAQFFADRSIIEALPETDEMLRNDLLPGEIP
jgi:putative hydroxymethylpyrimidine transport system substrate-binding protein